MYKNNSYLGACFKAITLLINVFTCSMFFVCLNATILILNVSTHYEKN
jgi:hypothetical protein